MKTKTLLLLALFAGMTTACVEKEKDLFEGEVNEIPNVPLENFKFTEDFEVPVKDGHGTVVKYNGEVIYRGNVATTIQVPKSLVGTRTGELTWHFDPDFVWNPGQWSYQYRMEGMLLFEDLDKDDFDYNDFVTRVMYFLDVNCHDNNGTSKRILRNVRVGDLQVWPLAMGNTLPLTFGFELVRTDTGELLFDYVIYEDVRANTFDGQKGFINTDLDIDHMRMNNRNVSYRNGDEIEPEDLDVECLAFNFYIQTNGGPKRYTADSRKAVATTNNQPFGVFIPMVSDFKYPIERASIYDAYPNFRSWLEGGNVSPFGEQNDELLYPWSVRENTW